MNTLVSNIIERVRRRLGLPEVALPGKMASRWPRIGAGAILRRDPGVTAYSESEPRDGHGRWTDFDDSTDGLSTRESANEYKGWMSPEGKDRTFAESEEHSRNIPIKLTKKEQQVVDEAITDGEYGHAVAVPQKNYGYARYGIYKSSDDRTQIYVHYDSAAGGAKAALHVLDKLTPQARGGGVDIDVTSKGGFGFRGTSSDVTFSDIGRAKAFVRQDIVTKRKLAANESAENLFHTMHEALQVAEGESGVDPLLKAAHDVSESKA